jgi:hypothetical protein
MSLNELQDLIGPSVDNFWNEVPTSRLRLQTGGFSDPLGVNINTARLCAPTDAQCVSDAGTAGDAVIPPVRDIIIACNRNAANFSSSTNVLAVTVPNSFSGKYIRGAVILINDTPGSAFFNLTRSDKISVIAHEIGHAIGLGHAEEKDRDALMYFKTVNLRTNLGQDDVDGVTYLYPIKLDGCGLFGGIALSMKDGSSDGDGGDFPFWPLLAGLGTMVLVSELGLRRFQKARPAL